MLESRATPAAKILALGMRGPFYSRWCIPIYGHSMVFAATRYAGGHNLLLRPLGVGICTIVTVDFSKEFAFHTVRE